MVELHSNFTIRRHQDQRRRPLSHQP
jgi:hypothetical protein